ncbi:membrane-spanning 4-domains subfamily A member 4A-like isoform X1 [Pleurodeles waltl]
MATTPAGNGVFVMTQYIPPTNSTTNQQMATVRQPAHLQKVSKGETKSMGVVQIMIGLISVFLGSIISFTNLHGIAVYTGVSFWTAIFFFISGGLSVSAEKKGTRCLVNCGLVMNILSAIVAAIGIIVYACDLATYKNYSDFDDKDCVIRGKKYKECLKFRETLISYRDGILVVLMLLLLLEFCISITASSYGCKTACRSSNHEAAQPSFVVENNGMQDPQVLLTQANGVPVCHGIPMMQDMSKFYGVPPLVPGVTSEIPTAPPPSYFKDVPGDSNEV